MLLPPLDDQNLQSLHARGGRNSVAAGLRRKTCFVLCTPHHSEETQDVLERVEAWPEAAQAELAELALEIDAGLGAGKYHPTPEELAGIRRGLKDAREGRFAIDGQIEALFKKRQPA
jgi:hypothetical protein